MAPWAEETARRGYRSSGGFPFKTGNTVGVLTLYSSEVGFFDERRISLLQALATDLSIALEREEAKAQVLAHQQRLRALANELATVEQRERARVATLLHDDVAQTLGGLKLHLALLNSQRSELQEELAPLLAMAGEAVSQTRTAMTELCPPVLRERGLTDALLWLGGVITQRYGLPVEIEDEARGQRLETSIETLVFQAVKELLQNVAKHAGATTARVSVKHDGKCLSLSVSDDGRGFAPAQTRTSQASGFGLFNLQERMLHIGGSATIVSAPGQGTRVTLTLPL